MTNQDQSPNQSQLVNYQIRVQGPIGPRWTDWFEPLTITYDQDITILTGPIADQAALRGFLCRIWDLNLVLISAIRLDAKPALGGRTENE